jgi:hypothetical protein
MGAGRIVACGDGPAAAVRVPSFIVRPSRLHQPRRAAVRWRQACAFRRSYPAPGSTAGGPATASGRGGSGWIIVQSGNYWSGTEYAPNTNNAWNFNTDDGNQNNDDKDNALFAVAVRAGG